jgi:polyisoprenyl-teichoic acid--peptidoglycan teichoic acid transferase
VLVVVGHVLLREESDPRRRDDVVGWLLVAVLVATGLVPAVGAVQYAGVYRDAAGRVFAPPTGTSPLQRPAAQGAAADPWAAVPRVNVLLVGSDASEERYGTRTDTVLLASIDTATGRTLLVSLPRNLEGVPFPDGSPAADEYPDGFRCPDRSCLLNALWQFGVDNRERYYPDASSDFEAGLTAVREGVESTVGLTVDTYAVVDLRGFTALVDAVGGVTVNVTERLPIGGSTGAGGQVLSRPREYIEPGVRRLGGWHALWYARSRFGSTDYARMARQRCLVGNLVDQVDPLRVLRVFPDLAAAAGDNIRTGVRTDDLPAWIELGRRVQAGGITSLSLTNEVVDVTDPDVDQIRSRVARAVERSVEPPEVTPTPGTPGGPASDAVARPAATADGDGTSTGDPVGSLDDVCPPVP